MNDEIFYGLLRQCIKKIKNIWKKKDRNACYSELSLLFINRFKRKLDAGDDGILSNLIKDLVLEILHAPIYENSFNEIISKISRSDIDNFDTVVVDNKNKNINIGLDYQKIKEFCLSKCVIAAYSNILNKLIKRKSEIKNKEIRDKINEYFTKHSNIYFCDLPKSNNSLTIFDGTIFIKKYYYSRAKYAFKIEDQIQNLAQILLMIFVEIMKILFLIKLLMII